MTPARTRILSLLGMIWLIGLPITMFGPFSTRQAAWWWVSIFTIPGGLFLAAVLLAAVLFCGFTLWKGRCPSDKEITRVFHRMDCLLGWRDHQ